MHYRPAIVSWRAGGLVDDDSVETSDPQPCKVYGWVHCRRNCRVTAEISLAARADHLPLTDCGTRFEVHRRKRHKGVTHCQSTRLVLAPDLGDAIPQLWSLSMSSELDRNRWP